LDDAKTAYTTTTTNEPPPPPKAAKKTAPEPQQSGRTLRSSTLAARSAALAEALVSPPPPPPPPRRAPKKESTGETVESAADAAAKPSSLLRQETLPVLRPRRKLGHGWWRPNGKGQEEQNAIRFVRTVNFEFRRMYERHVASVEGKLNLSEETDHLVQGFFDSVEALFDAMSGLEGVRPTDHRVNNLVRCALHVKEMASALAENDLTGCDFTLGLAACSAAARRGYSPGDALAEFKAAIDVVVKKHANRDAYLLQTAEEGRGGRDPKGNDVRFDAVTTVAKREALKKLEAETRAGDRERRYEAPTMATHALVVKAVADNIKNQGRNRHRRSARARAAANIATPKDCTPSHTLSDDGVPLFKTQPRLVPQGADNRPLIAEKAAARAVQHRAEKGKKTRAEIEADRRARLPDNVRASESASHAGQFTIRFCVNQSFSRAIRRKFKNSCVSVVKPGTDGYYASTTVAEEVRDEWIEEGRPDSWLAKAKY